ncbi:Putative glutathione-specific gamma-glutamylcyclotransferase 2 [Seminavis robusta]|uniref:glutathione-specific gamma-glutamylcyclotransferase n=1 Tax=Seminavis robusta TaxID=568900 RepID=A0A9N8H5V0_9STRA|nr:Putative glutathione-specific gamma-glutamylcyclotransferase 2 [Seminavis robusta]|eukprot:Sro96_g049600.1 Putative glutathione-specific gamma-glutamylcyclotransferase 2 (704) ;mRNA; f:62822-65075
MTATTFVVGSTGSSSSTPVWDPVEQIYVGGVVPGASNDDVSELLNASKGTLRVFGYGSLCWNPGAGALGHSSVKRSAGHAKGYRRVWAQKSTDHRGFPSFPGIECLAELDFREKGGYAREIVTVVQDDTGEEVPALLYRGTPENPAFWPLALQEIPLAAAVMAVSIGPSGPNHVYLNQLDAFLKQHTTNTAADDDDTCRLAKMVQQLQQHQLYFLYGCGSNQHGQIRQHTTTTQKPPDQDIPQLLESVLCTTIQSSTTNNNNTKKDKSPVVDPPQQLLAGGGHSGLITARGKLFLWGWNEQGQCGSNTNHHHHDNNKKCPLPVRECPDMLVKHAALGFSHTLAIERVTRKLYAWGDNTYGQCGPQKDKQSVMEMQPTCIHPDDRFIAVAAGVFHSAAITTQGALVTWGNGKHGQCLDNNNNKNWSPPDGSKLVRVVCGRHHTAVVDDRGRVWTLGDNKYGQLGRNVIQNGEHAKSKPRDSVPSLVDGPLGSDHDHRHRVVQLESGWSHLVARVQVADASTTAASVVYGWGRSDKGQLGVAAPTNVLSPHRLETSSHIQQVACGSESTYLLAEDGSIHSCGWNEHGNLGIASTSPATNPNKNDDDDEEEETAPDNNNKNDDEEDQVTLITPRGSFVFFEDGSMSELGQNHNLAEKNADDQENVTRITPLEGTERIVCPPTYESSKDKSQLLMAAGGAHFLVMKT